MICFDIFGHSVYVLYKNPILFLLPSTGAAISIIAEVFFITGLYNNNSDNYFPFSSIFVLFLFFIAFVITYFQLVIAGKVMLRKEAGGENNYYISESIVGIFIIYSIYALALVDIGALENDTRKSFAIKSDRFSLYTYKLESYNDIITIIPFSIFLPLLSVVFSFFFNMWMIQYYMLVQNQNQVANRHFLLYESFKNIVGFTIGKDKRAKMIPLLLVTLVISILGFVLTNIAIIPISESLNMYMFQFTISSAIGTIYSPFYLIYLFFILLHRSYVR
jgi:hypothetical protein